MYWYSRHLCLITQGAPSAKVCSSAQFCVLVFKASMVYLLGGLLAKEGLSDKYEHTSKLLLNNFQCNCLQEIHSHFGGSIGQSRFICQVWCSGIQGIYSQFTGRSIGQSRFICQFWCTGIYALLMGAGPLAKEGLSAKHEHTSKFTLASQKVFQYILYERPNKYLFTLM